MNIFSRGGIEFVAVLLGITVSLGVDDMRNDAALGEMEKTALGVIRSDMIADTLTLYKRIEQNEKRLVNALSLVHYINEDTILNDEEVIKGLNGLIYFNPFQVNKSNYVSMIANAGKNIIQNHEVSIALSNIYEKGHTHAISTREIRLQMAYEYMEDFMSAGGFDKIPSRFNVQIEKLGSQRDMFNKIVENKNFLARISSHIGNMSWMSGRYNTLLRRYRSTLKTVNAYIDEISN